MRIALIEDNEPLAKGIAYQLRDAGHAVDLIGDGATADTFLAQGDIHISGVSSAITIGGSPAGGEYIIFHVARKVASDNLAGDARLLSVKIEYVINSYSD